MIAVTGATGLLGSYILRKLAEEKVPVVAFKRKNSNTLLAKDVSVEWRDADVLDPVSLMDACKGITTVINTAAFVSFNPQHQKKIEATNVEGTRNVVNTCLALNIDSLIHVSSVAALGRQKGISNIDETSKWVPGALNTHYAESKYLAELEVWRGMEEGLKAAIVNPSVILAPVNTAQSSARIFDYVMKEKKFFTKSQLNYVDVRDVAEMIWRIYQQGITGERFIANGGHVSMKQLLDEIAKRLGKKAPSIEIGSAWLSLAARVEEWRSMLTGAEPMLTRQSVKVTRENFYYSNERAQKTLGMHFRPLEETLNWCCEYYVSAYSTNKQELQVAGM